MLYPCQTDYAVSNKHQLMMPQMLKAAGWNFLLFPAFVFFVSVISKEAS